LQPAPGWYDDPAAPDQLRWWDGSTWTGHISGAPLTDQPATLQRNPSLAVGLVSAAAVVLVAIVLAVVVLSDSGSTRTGQTATPRPGLTVDNPDLAALTARAKDADVPLLGSEGSATHTHTLVRVFVDATQKVVPAGIGLEPRSGTTAAVHTHEATGVVHVESPKPADRYQLWQFLTLWGAGTTQMQVCLHFLGGPCRVDVTVADPSAAERDAFAEFGPMPSPPTTPADGLNTYLDQGAVIEVRLTSAPS
jgi:hypothetical protein